MLKSNHKSANIAFKWSLWARFEQPKESHIWIWGSFGLRRVKSLKMREVVMRLWLHLCVNFLLQGEWKSLLDPIFSCCMVISRLTVIRRLLLRRIQSAFNGLYSGKLFRYQHPDLRQTRLPTAGQPQLDVDSDKWLSFLEKTKEMKFQDNITTFTNDTSKYNIVQMSDLTSMQDATEKWHYPETINEPLRLELNFTFHLEYFTEHIKLRKRLSLDSSDNLRRTKSFTSKRSILSLNSSIGNLAHSLRIVFQLFLIRVLLL